jgi:hypothetical protein
MDFAREILLHELLNLRAILRRIDRNEEEAQQGFDHEPFLSQAKEIEKALDVLAAAQVKP